MGSTSEQNRNDHYDAILATTPRSRAEVFLALADAEPRGLTRYELAEKLKRPVSSICGRVHELEQTDLIVETDDKRQTPYGGESVVLRIAPQYRIVKQMRMF
jgi:predicted transcriptional regulator